MILFLNFFVEESVIITLRFAKNPIIPKVDWETTVNIGSFGKITVAVLLLVKSKGGMDEVYWKVKLSISGYYRLQLIQPDKFHMVLVSLCNCPIQIHGIRDLYEITLEINSWIMNAATVTIGCLTHLCLT